VTAIRAAITQTTWTGDKQLGGYYNAAVVVGADGPSWCASTSSWLNAR
jgi:hypothetical protein